MENELQIDIWSDVVCPWCAIGKAHLDQALELFEHRDQVSILWHSFELDPEAPAVRSGNYAGISPKAKRSVFPKLSRSLR